MHITDIVDQIFQGQGFLILLGILNDDTTLDNEKKFISKNNKSEKNKTKNFNSQDIIDDILSESDDYDIFFDEEDNKTLSNKIQYQPIKKSNSRHFECEITFLCKFKF
ncbi:MAG: hypothetical protein ABRQ39_32615 [Candidatus Eremiobacterota bacterium]